MSTFKKVISIVLCFSLLAGSFAFLGDLIVPKASAAGETHITKTYEELDAAYNNFIYLGIDVYEERNGELTDGYVQPGDWLEYRMTILSDMYIGQSYPLVVYDNDFFDIRTVSSTTPATSNTYEANAKTDLLNHDHPSYEADWCNNTLTSKPCSELPKYTDGTMGMAASLYEGWDQLKTNWKVSTTVKNEAFIMKEDTWFANWYVRVKEGLSDGVTGVSQSRYDMYKFVVPYTYDDNGNCVVTSNKPASANANKLGDVLTADWSNTIPKMTGCKVGNLRYSNINWFNVDDTVHTFTIGEGTSAEAKTATFLENDGTEITEYTKLYDAGKPVALPAAVADQYGWADVATGAIVALEDGFAMPEKNVTYKRVLTTDEFDITVNLDGGAVTDASLLPEGTTVNEDGSVTIKAPINTEIDLNDALPAEALAKAGYKAAEWTDAAKIENINGLKVKISWVADVFNVTFYSSKEDYEAGNVLNATTVEYNKSVNYADINKGNTNADIKSKFAGWADAETGEVVSTSTSIKYTMTEDKAFYATWTDKKYTISLNVRDYENGGWKLLAAKYADNGTLSLNDIKAVAENAGYIYYGPSTTPDEFNRIKDAVAYDADKTIYVFTKTNISVTWQVPTFDAETGEVTENYTTETVTGETGALASNAFYANIKTTLSTAAHTGYKFVGWFDEDGNKLSYDSAVGTKFNTTDGLERTITAKYELVEYTIKFDLQNGALKNEYVIEGTFNIGDEIDVADVEIIDMKTNAKAYLPTIGLENKEQPNGSYKDRDGYKFAGWQISAGGNEYTAIDISKPITITEQLIKKSVSNDALTIFGIWEAEYYDLVFYYETGTDAEGNPTYTAMEPMKVKTGEALTAYANIAKEVAMANLPAGKSFISFKLNGDASSNVTSMPAYGAEFYATYNTKPISVYIDYNYGTEEKPLTAKDTMEPYKGQYNPQYGMDVDFVPEATADKLAISLTQEVKSTSIGDDKKPGEGYEVVEWKIYHVADGKDINDRANWVEGVNDEGSSLAKSTLIYQIQWKAHGEFFFRIYDTDHGLSRALGKNFKMYYWYNGFVRDKDTVGGLNKYPETNIIIFFIIELENWDWNGFFDINMWKSLTLKIEPYSINKSALNPKNWGALLEALFNGIGSGFGSDSGEEEAE